MAHLVVAGWEKSGDISEESATIIAFEAGRQEGVRAGERTGYEKGFAIGQKHGENIAYGKGYAAGKEAAAPYSYEWEEDPDISCPTCGL